MSCQGNRRRHTSTKNRAHWEQKSSGQSSRKSVKWMSREEGGDGRIVVVVVRLRVGSIGVGQERAWVGGGR